MGRPSWVPPLAVALVLLAEAAEGYCGTVYWILQTTSSAQQWHSVAYGNSLWVAVSQDAQGIMMTSPDGITWSSVAYTGTVEWQAVAFGNGKFVATGYRGEIAHSSDGSTWAAGTNAAGSNYAWSDLAYGGSLATPRWVAVSYDGTNGETMSSTDDGVNWAESATGVVAAQWRSVTFGWKYDTDGTTKVYLFVAVSSTGTTTARVMTSADGVSWSMGTATEANSWQSVTFGETRSSGDAYPLFVAVASDGTNRIMTSADGTTWSAVAAPEANSWQSVTYGNYYFVAVASACGGTTCNQVMTSGDGVTWTARAAAAALLWQSVAFGNNMVVAVALDSPTSAPTSRGETTCCVSGFGVSGFSSSLLAGSLGRHDSAAAPRALRIGNFLDNCFCDPQITADGAGPRAVLPGANWGPW